MTILCVKLIVCVYRLLADDNFKVLVIMINYKFKEHLYIYIYILIVASSPGLLPYEKIAPGDEAILIVRVYY